jgi:hypothetical protein
MCELGQLGVMAKKHHALLLVAELVNDVEQTTHRADIRPIIHHDILELVIELLGDDLGRRERARLAGLDRIKSGFTSRFANRLPIFGASRLPRLANGRSLSGNAVSSQLDFAWRMRNSVFMPRSIPICALLSYSIAR